MSLPVFISGNPIPAIGEHSVLDGGEGYHAVTVMRLARGECMTLIDGTGVRATARISSIIAKDQLRAVIVDRVEAPIPDPRVTIVQALPKSERSELAVDLATQGGADVIIPWAASRSIAQWSSKKAAKQEEKWRLAAVAATKQSRRTRIPVIEQCTTTRALVERVHAVCAAGGLCLVLHESAHSFFRDIVREEEFARAHECVVIVGPEGGITDEECALFTHAGAHTVGLGPEVLRTASAGLVALAAIGAHTQRWPSSDPR